MEWEQVKKRFKTPRRDYDTNFQKFCGRRCREGVFASIIDGKPQWQVKGPG